jgi:2-oxoglutarate dehydrogenase complex dehydrogenase (E1) component-like enzyme
MINHDLRKKSPHTAITRIEQLYPIRWDLLNPTFERFPNLEEVVWLQEEPDNMGAWDYLRTILESAVDGRWPLLQVSRPRASSPSEGSSAIHNRNQKVLIEMAYTMGASGNIEMN